MPRKFPATQQHVEIRGRALDFGGTQRHYLEVDTNIYHIY